MYQQLHALIDSPLGGLPTCNVTTRVQSPPQYRMQYPCWNSYVQDSRVYN